MNKLFLVIFGLFIMLSGCGESKGKNEIFSVEKAEASLERAGEQYKRMINTLPDSVLPRTFQGDTMIYSNIYWWTSGFYPGSLWYLYEHTGDETFLNEALKRTLLLDPVKNVTNDHDVGFMLYCSYGNGLRITGNEDYADVLLRGAASLSTRYNPVVGCIKSWDWSDKWQYPVIIDNMMNLELLMWAHQESSNNQYEKISLDHSFTTLENHYREDHSCYHVVDYDPETGEVLEKVTHQGYSDESAWARGQSWGFYGFTMMYREAKDPAFLEKAENIANFLLNHPNMPEDNIPYWDFDASNIPDALRDASASAIMASALLELSTFTEGESSDFYFRSAEKILATLSEDQYLAEPGENGNFILKHSVGHLPGDSEVDVPLTYADYYFIESLMRYIRLKMQTNI
ncbi:MAG: glycoside hydrolase family 88 protein [Bacteroidales bacterium]